MELDYQIHPLQLSYPFKVAYSSKKFAQNVFITLRHENTIGYGEAAPSYFFHESAETVTRFFEELRHEISQASLIVDSVMDRLEKISNGDYAAKTAINMALFDIIGKQAAVPVYRLFDIDPDKNLVTSFTIGIDDLTVIKEKVIAANNFPVLKVKLGTDYDYEIIELIRGITNIPLRIDANEGWTKEEAVEKINWLETKNVELIEQPLPAAEIEATKWIRKRVHLPLFADESMTSSKNMDKLQGAFDGVNIKLMKCGGLSEALKMVKQARQMNLKTMLGCFIESSLAITAATHIAPLFDYIDLDGALLIKSDPFRGAQISNGQIKIPDGPGLGVELIGFE